MSTIFCNFVYTIFVNLKIFAERLKELRIERKLNLKQLGDVVGVSHVAVMGWESGNIIPLADKVSKLAKFFRVSSDYLMGNED